MIIQDTLKPREIEILRLMADELTNREISEQLYIGVETVRWYAKQIYSKLDVSGREEAALKAQELGLLDIERADETPQLPNRHKHNLPTQLTSFIGREKQIIIIKDLLEDTRLLTLTGPGGTGKTRLSIQVAEQLLDNFTDGVFFVDLAPISDPHMVASAVANTLGIFESSGQPIVEAINRSIGQRKLLLLLDNYEHVMEAASLVTDLLMTSPNVKIMVTSREPLRVSGEQVYAVLALSLSNDQQEAVSLFVQRSQAVKQSFQLNKANTDAVIEICQRLDGMPLAIELAASLSRLLTPDAILARMDNRFQTFKSGSRDAPVRQQTLRNTIDWSYNLLDDGEKLLFTRLAVFRGGRSLEAIEAVCGDRLPIDVFDGLMSLVDKNMVRQIEDSLGEPRFIMLETLQEYAHNCLSKIGESDDIQRRHAQYFADLTAYAQPFLRQSGQEYWFPRLTIEHDNIRGALQWSLFGGDSEIGLRIVSSLSDFWFYEGFHIEGQRWVEQAMEHLDDVEPLLKMGVLETAGILASGRQELQSAVRFHSQALSIAHDLGNEDELAWKYILLAMEEYDASQHSSQAYEDAISTCEKGLSLFRKLDNRIGLAQGLNILGNIHRIHEDFPLSQVAYEECLDICYETGERRREAMMLSNLSKVAIGLGNYSDARQLAYDSLALCHQLRFDYMTVLFLGASVSVTLSTLGETKASACVLGASSVLQDSMNISEQPNNMLLVQRNKDALHELLSEHDFQIAYDKGRKMSLDEAVEFALQKLQDREGKHNE
jgi:predicted ATPase/DNA-binding CsgD family transcriptional regulator